MAGASFRVPLGRRKITVVTLPPYSTGGTVVRLDDGVTTNEPVAAGVAYRLLLANASRRDQAVANTGMNPAEYAFHASLKPGEGWVCSPGGGGFQENFAHNGEVYAVSALGTTVRVIEG